MTEVRRLIIQTEAPTAKSPGAVEYVHYTVEKGILTLTDAAGAPIRTPDGHRYVYELKPEQDARVVAGRLSWQIRQQSRSSNFHRRLTISADGIA